VAIWLMRLAPGGRFTLPAVPGLVARTLYVVEGSGLKVEGTPVAEGYSARLLDFTATLLINDAEDACDVLLLQGRPIAEPVVQHGPFVMNEPAEIQRAFADYRRTGFGGWPWPVEEAVHARDAGRFARFPDGSVGRPKG
jgi:redox-sensitive bicupin YhaK (pirin superfamily)